MTYKSFTPEFYLSTKSVWGNLACLVWGWSPAPEHTAWRKRLEENTVCEQNQATLGLYPRLSNMTWFPSSCRKGWERNFPPILFHPGDGMEAPSLRGDLRGV